jgi:hypothetical protein
MSYVYVFLNVVNEVALLLVLILLLRHPFGKFPALLGYVSWELISNVVLTSYDQIYKGAAAGTGASADAVRWYARLYWGNDVIVDLFRFILVIVLIYRATSGGVRSPLVGRILAGVIGITMVLPLFLFPMGSQAWPRSSWFNSTSEMLNFGAAIMNVVLWGALVANRKRDPQIAIVSVGLGVVVTGAAISYGLRHFFPVEARFLPNLFLMLTQLAGWTLWCRAFWLAPAARPPSDNARASRKS